MLKTYSHLERAVRPPSEYEIGTTDLGYHHKRPFEVKTPANQWMTQFSSSFVCHDWSAFFDTNEMTYFKYVHKAQERSAFVQRVLSDINRHSFDARLEKSWVKKLELVLPVLVFPLHGAQMLSSYLGFLAPNSRVTTLSMFQAIDELRWIESLAQRSDQLMGFYPTFGMNAKGLWLDHPMWQPWRKLTEELLICYDWSEAFVAINLCAKPWFYSIAFSLLCDLCTQEKDLMLREIILCFIEDYEAHRSWSLNLAGFLQSKSKENKGKIEGYLTRYFPIVKEAISPFAALDPDFFERFEERFLLKYIRELSRVNLEPDFGD